MYLKEGEKDQSNKWLVFSYKNYPNSFRLTLRLCIFPKISIDENKTNKINNAGTSVVISKKPFMIKSFFNDLRLIVQKKGASV